MKTKPNIFYKVLAALTILASLFLTCSATAATPNANEFWISTNATVNFYSSGAGGTIDSPLDGSTPANFESNMNSLPANSTIHIMAGVYQTFGADNNGWTIKTGQKILGSGIDVTTLRLAPGAPINNPIMYCPVGTNVEVSDLTCDGNCSSINIASYWGVQLLGTQNAARRVKVINLGANPATGGQVEVWGFSVGRGSVSTGDSAGNIIEECEFSHFYFTGGGYTSAIELGSGSGIIRNNRVFLTPGNNHAFNGSYTHDVLVEGNYVEGANVAYYVDTGGSTNLTIVHNTFKNCIGGVFFVNEQRQNITIAYNNIEIVEPEDTSSYSWGISFNWYNPPPYCTNVTIIGNTFTLKDPGTGTGNAYAIYMGGYVSGLIIADNKTDASMTNGFFGCSNVSMYNNTDLSGNYIPSMNIPMLGNTPVTSFGLSLVGSAGASPALTALGLPSNPAVIITNGSSQAIALASNLTVSGNVVETAGKAYVYDGQNLAYGITSLGDYFFGGAGNFTMTGAGNTASGSQSFASNTTGNNNTAYGRLALDANTTGADNVANGFAALYNNTTGGYNVANGANALHGNTAGNNNTANGFLALNNNDSGHCNTADGQASLSSNTNGGYNTADGCQALFQNTSGSYNIGLGYMAGYNITTGSSNIDIGNAGVINDDKIIRIGTPGIQTSTYIAGVINGNGSGLTNLNASQLTSGTIPQAQLPSAVVTNNSTGLTLNGTFAGNGSGLTSLNASQLTTGTIPQTQLPSAVVTNNATGVTLNGTFSGNGSGLTGITAAQVGAAASTNTTIWSSLSVTDVTATNWAMLSVTPSNAVISMRGVNVAILQTNGVLNAYNGLSTTISNGLSASRVTMNFTTNPYRWTNTTPANVVVYVNVLKGSVGYNGSYIAGPVTNDCVTVMLKPSSYLSVTNNTASGSSVLAWHPF